MKKAIIISISIVTFLLVSFILGIFVIPFYRIPMPLTLWEKKQLEEEYNWVCDWQPMWIDQSDNFDLTYYFGEYNGYYIISRTYDVTVCWGETVGDYEFEYGDRSIFALKKGGVAYEHYKLSDLYAKGTISNDDLAKIYEYYLDTLKF